MVQNCVVLGCGSKWYPGCTLMFHSFPKDPTRRGLWLSTLKLKNKFYETAKICSYHFVASDYKMSNRLKSTAVPFYPEELEQSQCVLSRNCELKILHVTGHTEASDIEEKKQTLKVKDIRDPTTESNPSFNDYYKEFVNKLKPAVKDPKQDTPEDKLEVRNVYRKKKIKAEVGQFIPSLKKESVKTPELEIKEEIESDDQQDDFYDLTNVSVKNKVDMDYEVVEQEDDYNILILKI